MNANKFYVALLGAVAAAGPLVKDGNVSWEDAVTIAIAFLTALGVYGVSNAVKAPDA